MWYQSIKGFVQPTIAGFRVYRVCDGANSINILPQSTSTAKKLRRPQNVVRKRQRRLGLRGGSTTRRGPPHFPTPQSETTTDTPRKLSDVIAGIPNPAPTPPSPLSPRTTQTQTPLADIKSLTVSSPKLLQSATPAFEKYNEEQLTTVKLPGGSQHVCRYHA